MTDRPAAPFDQLPPDAPRLDRLVTVESQREVDLLSGQLTERTFVKLYVAARESGLLAAISDRDWKTLCTLATYMDGAGSCYPSQAALAKTLGCSRQMANERVRSLAAFRFQGHPVLLMVSGKGKKTADGTWAGNGYRVLPISRMRIYATDERDASHENQPGEPGAVSRVLDTVGDGPATVSSETVTARLDTNKNHPLEQEPSNFERQKPTHNLPGDGEEPDPTPQQPDQSGSAALQGIGAVLARRPLRRATPDEDQMALRAAVAEVGGKLGDRAPASSLTRARRLQRDSGLTRHLFIDRLYRALARTQEQRKGMGYCFAVLEDLLGLRTAGGSGQADRRATSPNQPSNGRPAAREAA